MSNFIDIKLQEDTLNKIRTNLNDYKVSVNNELNKYLEQTKPVNTLWAGIKNAGSSFIRGIIMVIPNILTGWSQMINQAYSDIAYVCNNTQDISSFASSVTNVMATEFADLIESTSTKVLGLGYNIEKIFNENINEEEWKKRFDDVYNFTTKVRNAKTDRISGKPLESITDFVVNASDSSRIKNEITNFQTLDMYREADELYNNWSEANTKFNNWAYNGLKEAEKAIITEKEMGAVEGDKLASTVGGIMESIGQVVGVALTSKALGKTLKIPKEELEVIQNISFFSSIYGRTFAEDMEQGIDPELAHKHAISIAITEHLTEQVGGLRVGKSSMSDVSQKFLDKIAEKTGETSFRSIISRLGVSFVEEGLEEVMADFFEPQMGIMYGDTSMFETSRQQFFSNLMMDFLAGGVSGGVFNLAESGMISRRSYLKKGTLNEKTGKLTLDIEKGKSGVEAFDAIIDNTNDIIDYLNQDEAYMLNNNGRREKMTLEQRQEFINDSAFSNLVEYKDGKFVLKSKDLIEKMRADVNRNVVFVDGNAQTTENLAYNNVVGADLSMGGQFEISTKEEVNKQIYDEVKKTKIGVVFYNGSDFTNKVFYNRNNNAIYVNSSAIENQSDVNVVLNEIFSHETIHSLKVNDEESYNIIDAYISDLMKNKEVKAFLDEFSEKRYNKKFNEFLDSVADGAIKEEERNAYFIQAFNQSNNFFDIVNDKNQKFVFELSKVANKYGKKSVAVQSSRYGKIYKKLNEKYNQAIKGINSKKADIQSIYRGLTSAVVVDNTDFYENIGRMMKEGLFPVMVLNQEFMKVGDKSITFESFINQMKEGKTTFEGENGEKINVSEVFNQSITRSLIAYSVYEKRFVEDTKKKEKTYTEEEKRELEQKFKEKRKEEIKKDILTKDNINDFVAFRLSYAFETILTNPELDLSYLKQKSESNVTLKSLYDFLENEVPVDKKSHDYNSKLGECLSKAIKMVDALNSITGAVYVKDDGYRKIIRRSNISDEVSENKYNENDIYYTYKFETFGGLNDYAKEVLLEHINNNPVESLTDYLLEITKKDSDINFFNFLISEEQLKEEKNRNDNKVLKKLLAKNESLLQKIEIEKVSETRTRSDLMFNALEETNEIIQKTFYNNFESGNLYINNFSDLTNFGYEPDDFVGISFTNNFGSNFDTTPKNIKIKVREVGDEISTILAMNGWAKNKDYSMKATIIKNDSDRPIAINISIKPIVNESDISLHNIINENLDNAKKESADKYNLVGIKFDNLEPKDIKHLLGIYFRRISAGDVIAFNKNDLKYFIEFFDEEYGDYDDISFNKISVSKSNKDSEVAYAKIGKKGKTTYELNSFNNEVIKAVKEEVSEEVKPIEQVDVNDNNVGTTVEIKTQENEKIQVELKDASTANVIAEVLQETNEKLDNVEEVVEQIKEELNTETPINVSEEQAPDVVAEVLDTTSNVDDEKVDFNQPVTKIKLNGKEINRSEYAFYIKNPNGEYTIDGVPATIEEIKNANRYNDYLRHFRTEKEFIAIKNKNGKIIFKKVFDNGQNIVANLSNEIDNNEFKKTIKGISDRLFTKTKVDGKSQIGRSEVLTILENKTGEKFIVSDRENYSNFYNKTKKNFRVDFGDLLLKNLENLLIKFYEKIDDIMPSLSELDRLHCCLEISKLINEIKLAHNIKEEKTSEVLDKLQQVVNSEAIYIIGSDDTFLNSEERIKQIIGKTDAKTYAQEMSEFNDALNDLYSELITKDKEIKNALKSKDKLEQRLKSFTTQFANFHIKYASETWYRKNKTFDAVKVFDFIQKHKDGTFIDVKSFAKRVISFLDEIREIEQKLENKDFSIEYANSSFKRLYRNFLNYLANESEKVFSIIKSYENLPEEVKTKCDEVFKENNNSESFSSYLKDSLTKLKNINNLFLNSNIDRLYKLLENNSEQVKSEQFKLMCENLEYFLNFVTSDENGNITEIKEEFNFDFIKSERIIETISDNFFIDPAVKLLYREMTKNEKLIYDFVKTLTTSIEKRLADESIAKKSGNNSGLIEFLNILTEFNERLKNKTLYQNLESKTNNLIIRLSELIKLFDGVNLESDISKSFNEIVIKTAEKVLDANGNVIGYDFSKSKYQQKLVQLRQGFNYFSGAIGKMFFGDVDYFSEYMFVTKNQSEENFEIEATENDLRLLGLKNFGEDAIPSKVKNGLEMIKNSLQIDAINTLSGEKKLNSEEFSADISEQVTKIDNSIRENGKSLSQLKSLIYDATIPTQNLEGLYSRIEKDHGVKFSFLRNFLDEFYNAVEIKDKFLATALQAFADYEEKYKNAYKEKNRNIKIEIPPELLMYQGNNTSKKTVGLSQEEQNNYRQELLDVSVEINNEISDFYKNNIKSIEDEIKQKEQELANNKTNETIEKLKEQLTNENITPEEKAKIEKQISEETSKLLEQNKDKIKEISDFISDAKVKLKNAREKYAELKADLKSQEHKRKKDIMQKYANNYKGSKVKMRLSELTTLLFSLHREYQLNSDSYQGRNNATHHFGIGKNFALTDYKIKLKDYRKSQEQAQRIVMTCDASELESELLKIIFGTDDVSGSIINNTYKGTSQKITDDYTYADFYLDSLKMSRDFYSRMFPLMNNEFQNTYGINMDNDVVTEDGKEVSVYFSFKSFGRSQAQNAELDLKKRHNLGVDEGYFMQTNEGSDTALEIEDMIYKFQDFGQSVAGLAFDKLIYDYQSLMGTMYEIKDENVTGGIISSRQQVSTLFDGEASPLGNNKIRKLIEASLSQALGYRFNDLSDIEKLAIRLVRANVSFQMTLSFPVMLKQFASFMTISINRKLSLGQMLKYFALMNKNFFTKYTATDTYKWLIENNSGFAIRNFLGVPAELSQYYDLTNLVSRIKFNPISRADDVVLYSVFEVLVDEELKKIPSENPNRLQLARERANEKFKVILREDVASGESAYRAIGASKKDFFSTWIYSFQGENIMQFSKMVRYAIAKDGKGFGLSVLGVIGSSIMATLVDALRKAVRGTASDKDDKEFWSDIALNDFVLSNVIGVIPVINHITNWIEFNENNIPKLAYEPKDGAFSGLYDLTRFTISLGKDIFSGTSDKTLYKLRKVINAGGKLVGIPTNQLFNMLQSTSYLLSLTGSNSANAVYSALTGKDYTDAAKSAIKSGNTGQAKYYINKITSNSNTTGEIIRVMTAKQKKINLYFDREEFSYNGKTYRFSKETKERYRRKLSNVLAIMFTKSGYRKLKDDAKFKAIQRVFNYYYNCLKFKTVGKEFTELDMNSVIERALKNLQ